VIFRPILLIVAVTLLACCLPFDRFAIIGLIVFGGYVFFYTANCAKGVFTKINNKNDISYGIYLYAWPASKTMFWYFPSMPLLLNGAVTLVIALCAKAIIWRYLEEPILRRCTALLKKLPADQGSVAGGQRARPS
jgi:peptidoglycan/LPS O-acetylase OafA/YrhL